MSVDDTFYCPPDEPAWRETMVRVRGPLVAAMREAFEASWRELGPVMPRPAADESWQTNHGETSARLILSSPRLALGEALFLAAIKAARTSAWITNPFVVPSWRISTAIVSAARSGIDVRLLVPGRYHRFEWVRDAMCGFYTEFLRAGVKILEYQAAMIHAKTIVVDDAWTSVGSFNLDARSFFYNDEIAVAACDERFAKSVREAFSADCRFASVVTLAEWRSRGSLRRFRETIASAFRDHL
jgi:cardiolipin synthase